VECVLLRLNIYVQSSRRGGRAIRTDFLIVPYLVLEEREISDFGFGDYLSLAAIGIGIPLAVFFVLGYVVHWARQASEANP
jgi:hypothetical protein